MRTAELLIFSRVNLGVAAVPWTYDPTQLATSTLYQVRLEIQDTDTNNQLLQDEEITYALSVEANMWGGAARCSEILSRKFSMQADRRMGLRLFVLYTKMAAQYVTMAKELRRKAIAFNLPINTAQKVADKTANQQDTSLVQPAFSRNMQSNPEGADPNS